MVFGLTKNALLTKLVLRLSLFTAGAVIAVFLALNYQLDEHVNSLRDRSLAGQADDVAHAIVLGEDGHWRIELPPELESAYADPGGLFTFQVRDENEVILLSSAQSGGPLDLAPIGARDQESFFLIERPELRDVYGAQILVTIGGRDLFVRVGQSADHDDVLIDQLLEEFFDEVAWVLVPLFSLLLLLNIITVQRGLAPIRAISIQAASITPRRTDVRLREAGLPEEVRPLVHAVNAALDRLEQGFTSQREFTADAAHELRTPLAVLAAHLDTLEDRDVARSLRQDVDAMARIVDQLMRVARLDGTDNWHQVSCELNEAARAVAAFMAPLALKTGRSLALVETQTPVMVMAPDADVSHAIRNLVENALYFTPVGTEVEITVNEMGAIRVRDHGPGVPDDLKSKIFQRFWRAQRNETRGGAGLGLAIVSRTAEVAGGSVSVEDAPGGGAVFILTLPLEKDQPHKGIDPLR